MPDGYVGQQSFRSSTELIGNPESWRNSVQMLDVGCGTGALAIHLCQRFPKLRGLGIDNDANMITKAAAAAQKHGLGARTAFEWRDMDELSIDNQFDAIISADSIQHSSAPINVLSELLSAWSRLGPFHVSVWCFSENRIGRALARRWGCGNALPKGVYEQAKLTRHWSIETSDISPVFETRSKLSLESLLELETPFRKEFGNRVFEKRLSLEKATVSAITAGLISHLLITGIR